MAQLHALSFLFHLLSQCRYRTFYWVLWVEILDCILRFLYSFSIGRILDIATNPSTDGDKLFGLELTHFYMALAGVCQSLPLSR